MPTTKQRRNQERYFHGKKNFLMTRCAMKIQPNAIFFCEYMVHIVKTFLNDLGSETCIPKYAKRHERKPSIAFR